MPRTEANCKSRISRCPDSYVGEDLPSQGTIFPCKETASTEIKEIQLTKLYMDFQMARGNALKLLKNAQKLLKKLSCCRIRGRDLLGLETG